MASAPSEAKFRIVYGLVKTASLLIGLAGTLVSLMALTGAVTERLWLRITVAVVVALVVPLVVADRLIPDKDPARARGLPTDVLALFWLACAVAFALLGANVARGPLQREGDRLAAEGMPLVARVAYGLAGLQVQWPSADTAAAASASASASNSAVSAEGGIPPVEAGILDDASQGPEAGVEAGKRREGTERTPAELFKEVSPAVVAIAVKQKAGSEGGGTGFLIDRDGVIVTNHHVIDNAGGLRVKFLSGAKFSSVELLADDAALDLALLKIDYSAPDAGPRPEVEPLRLGDSDTVQVGERVISIGNPLGLEHTLTDGLVSARRLYEGKQWIQMSAPVSPGNSGGPLFNMQGEVIGVTTAQLGFYARGQNLNLAIPINVLKGMLKPTYPGRRKIGDDSSPSSW